MTLTRQDVLDRIAAHREELRAMGVSSLSLFGSLARDEATAGSDVDLLVEFDDEPAQLFDRYFGLRESLEALYGRPVDLVAAGSLRNPYFIAAVNETRRPVYAREDAEVA